MFNVTERNSIICDCSWQYNVILIFILKEHCWHMFLRSNPKTILHLSLVILLAIEIGRLTLDKKDLFDENSYFQRSTFLLMSQLLLIILYKKGGNYFFNVSALFLRIFFKLFFLTSPTNLCLKWRCRFSSRPTLKQLIW